MSFGLTGCLLTYYLIHSYSQTYQSDLCTYYENMQSVFCFLCFGKNCFPVFWIIFFETLSKIALKTRIEQHRKREKTEIMRVESLITQDVFVDQKMNKKNTVRTQIASIVIAVCMTNILCMILRLKIIKKMCQQRKFLIVQWEKLFF